MNHLENKKFVIKNTKTNKVYFESSNPIVKTVGWLVMVALVIVFIPLMILYALIMWPFRKVTLTPTEEIISFPLGGGLTLRR